MSRVAFASAVLALVACGASTPSVSFQGQREPPVLSAEELERAPSVPRNARVLGKLSVECCSQASFEAFSDRSLAELDCSPERLTRMLHEAGAAAGGDVLVALSCAGSGSLSCSATVARSNAPQPRRTAPKPSPYGAAGGLGADIRISFAPTGKAPGRPQRSADNVRELPSLPPSHRAVGSLEARCDARCPELAVRDGLRIAAGRLGVEDVVGVRCFDWLEGHRCLGTAAVAERAEGVSELPRPRPPTRSARGPRSRPAG